MLSISTHWAIWSMCCWLWSNKKKEKEKRKKEIGISIKKKNQTHFFSCMNLWLRNYEIWPCTYKNFSYFAFNNTTQNVLIKTIYHFLFALSLKALIHCASTNSLSTASFLPTAERQMSQFDIRSLPVLILILCVYHTYATCGIETDSISMHVTCLFFFQSESCLYHTYLFSQSEKSSHHTSFLAM